MAKNNNLQDYLKDLYKGIKFKKPDASNNPQDFRTEIEAIQSGIEPTGNLDIFENGSYNIKEKETVTVAVDGDSLWGDYFGGKVAGGDLSYTFAYSNITDASPYLAGYDTSAVSRTSYMFDSSKKLTNVPLFNTSNVTDMGYMFRDCQSLTSVPLFDTSKATKTNAMFMNCKNLTEAPQLNTGKATDMSYMFYGTMLTNAPQLDTSKATNLGNYFNYCHYLKEAIVNTDSATSISSLFAKCYELEKAEISSMDKITSQYSASSYAQDCYSLKQFIIRNMTKVPIFYNSSSSYPFNNVYHIEGKYHDTYNPEALQDGGIYVPDEFVDQMKAATGWSYYGDVIYPLSQLPESYEITDRPYIKKIEKAGSYTTFSYNANGYYYATDSSSRASKFHFVVPEGATKKSIKIEVEIASTGTSTFWGIYGGFIGKLDTDVTTLGTNLQESDCELCLDALSPDDQLTYTVVYDNLPAGEHFINIGAQTKTSTEFRVRVTYE